MQLVDFRGGPPYPLVPAGLSGWTWGELHLSEARVQPGQLIGEPREGMRLLQEHFGRIPAAPFTGPSRGGKRSVVRWR
jgi:hypothetical protein